MKNRKLTIARIVLTVLTAAAIAGILFNSSRSAVESTAQSSPLTQMINSFLDSLPIPFTVTETFVRKAAHFAEYEVLGALLTVTVALYVLKRSRTLIVSLSLGAVAAVCDELIQLFPEGRSCEVRDMLIDFCGVVCAVLFVMLIISFIEKRYRKSK